MPYVYLDRPPPVSAFCYTKWLVGGQGSLSGVTTWRDGLRWYFHNHISYSAADDFRPPAVVPVGPRQLFGKRAIRGGNHETADATVQQDPEASSGPRRPNSNPHSSPRARDRGDRRARARRAGRGTRPARNHHRHDSRCERQRHPGSDRHHHQQGDGHHRHHRHERSRLLSGSLSDSRNLSGERRASGLQAGGT